jgi:RND superfamily putative drug exporter
VVFAGGAVVVAILGLVFAGIPFIATLGLATAITIAVMVLAAVTLLPALLGLLGHRVNRLRLRRRTPDIGRPATGNAAGVGRAGVPASTVVGCCTPLPVRGCCWPWRRRCCRCA